MRAVDHAAGTVLVPRFADPVSCEEYAYGLGPPTGILVLRYRTDGGLGFRERQDFLHQVYWSPDAVLVAVHTAQRGQVYVEPHEAFWAHRGASHELLAPARQTVFRLCLRETPELLAGVRTGPVAIDTESRALIERIARPGVAEGDALRARTRIMAGLSPAGSTGDGSGKGHAQTVLRAWSQDPADPTGLAEWARRLHIGTTTLQRDFEREFGASFTRTRTDLRLRMARQLLASHPVGEVARRVGYTNTSAFVAAYARRFGRTPGEDVRRSA